MIKITFLIILLTTYSFSSFWCPKGCLDSSLEETYIQQGKTNYDTNDENMLENFTQVANKMQKFYQEFENQSLEMIEKNARLQYMEAVTSKQSIFELNKALDLKALEIDASSSDISSTK
ncbi:hypothetical protein CRU99_13110 [Malaciobacter mytili]|uniref:hypothetical protein n=1 Tax=Malaciobacter mytili TaxID=603050 RepID=UPI00100A45D1|nr:hypothetical protein [Malaciobacter mytili]RXI36940.1 hypothetical protein CRU99_13110 [Malaciobacter mytili]